MILEPVQNAGGCFTPQEGYFQRVREICDRHGVLLISDEVICSWGRLGHWFGCERYDYRPDIVTTAKGLTSAYAPMGAVIVSDAIAEPFLQDKTMFAHGFTFGGHPIAAAAAHANLDIFEREDINAHVRAKEPELRAMLESLRDLPIVGDVRGAGFFQAIELVKDKETRESFDDDESERLLRGFLSGELYKQGLICRADDRGDPVIQLSPAADRGHRAVRGDRGDPAEGPDGGLGEDRRRQRSRGQSATGRRSCASRSSAPAARSHPRSCATWPSRTRSRSSCSSTSTRTRRAPPRSATAAARRRWRTASPAPTSSSTPPATASTSRRCARASRRARTTWTSAASTG